MLLALPLGLATDTIVAAGDYATKRLATLVRQVLRPSALRQDAVLIAVGTASSLLIAVHSPIMLLLLGNVQRLADASRGILTLAGLTMALGCAIFALRRWRDLSREIKVRIAAEARATAMASQDPLTGLPNRRALATELALAVSRAERSGETLSLLLLDLDRFKSVNDVHGHLAGDRLLEEITARLRATVRAGEFVARLGGDEFAVIVVHHPENRAAPVAAASRIAEAISATVHLGKLDIHVGASTGIAAFPHDASDVESLMRRADIALYRAKQRGRGRCEFYDAVMGAEVSQRAAIEGDLRRAIACNEIVPYFQPLIDLRSGRVVGFEALARWPHRDRGFIPPSDFIPIAEDCGLIGELGMAILRQSCRQARLWTGEPMLSVNISPLQLADDGLAEKILAILADEGLPARRLEVEITENALISDLGAARIILNRLKAAGASISLDDFGTGYSSLRHLSSLPFDRVKIDRAFLENLDERGDAVRMLRAIVGLCANLGLSCTGEGAETVEQVALLRSAGCTLGQGWYFGEAVDAAKAAKLAIEGRIPLAKLHAAVEEPARIAATG